MKLLITSVVAGLWWLAFFSPEPLFFGGQLWPILVGLVLLALVPASLALRHLEVAEDPVARPAMEQARQPKAA